MRRRLWLVQVTVTLLVLIGAASVIIIGVAVANLYDQQRQTDVRLCVIAQAEWRQIRRLAANQGISVPPTPPPCPKP